MMAGVVVHIQNLQAYMMMSQAVRKMVTGRLPVTWKRSSTAGKFALITLAGSLIVNMAASINGTAVSVPVNMVRFLQIKSAAGEDGHGHVSYMTMGKLRPGDRISSAI
jgi:hypothetical protein